MAQLVDIGIPALGAVVAAFLVLRWGIWGFIPGVVVFWAFVFLRTELLYHVDPRRENGVLDAFTVAIGGWIEGFVWCVPFLLGRFAYRYVRARRITQSPGPS